MSDMLTSWIAMFFADLTWQMTSNLFVFCVMAMIVVWLIKQSIDPTSEIHLADLILDPATKRIGTSYFRLNMAYVLTSFLYVVVVMKDASQFTPATAVYAGLWVIDKARSSYFDTNKPEDKKEDEPK